MARGLRNFSGGEACDEVDSWSHLGVDWPGCADCLPPEGCWPCAGSARKGLGRADCVSKGTLETGAL